MVFTVSASSDHRRLEARPPWAVAAQVGQIVMSSKAYDWTLCSGGPGDASGGSGRARGRLLRPGRSFKPKLTVRGPCPTMHHHKRTHIPLQHRWCTPASVPDSRREGDAHLHHCARRDAGCPIARVEHLLPASGRQVDKWWIQDLLLSCAPHTQPHASVAPQSMRDIGGSEAQRLRLWMGEGAACERGSAVGSRATCPRHLFHLGRRRGMRCRRRAP